MRTRKRRGFVLVLVVVVVAVLALACLSFSDLMLSERKAAQTAARQSQARALAQSGVELARQFLDRLTTDQTTAGGLYDNQQRFYGVMIANEELPQERGRTSIIAPRLDGDHTFVGLRYGLQDESTRINLANILQYGQTTKASGGGQGGATSGTGTSGTGTAGTGTAGTGTSGTGSAATGTSGAGGASGTQPGASDASADVPKTILMNLPGMTDEIAEAILDWIDADSTPRTNGAESDYYGALTPPYTPRNGPPVTIDELLSVRGVTPQLLYGFDAARMGLLPPEMVADGNLPDVDNSDGLMDHGWAAYLTLWSAESSNLKADGTAKVNLNGTDMQKLHDDLVSGGVSEELALFIVAYRTYGASKATAQTISAGPAATASDLTIANLKATVNINSVLDLVGVTVEVPDPTAANANTGGTDTSGSGNTGGGNAGRTGGGGNSGGGTGGSGTGGSGTGGGGTAANTKKKYLKSPLTEDGGTLSTNLPTLLDNATVQSGSKPIVGRININQAPRLVLMCVPGMTTEIADQIIGTRQLDPANAPQDQHYEVWPLIEGIIPLATMKAMQPYVTAGGNVYRAQAIGYFDKDGPVGRVEAIFDSTQHPTKLLFWKDVSRIPGGFPFESAGQESATPTEPDATSPGAQP